MTSFFFSCHDCSETLEKSWVSFSCFWSYKRLLQFVCCIHIEVELTLRHLTWNNTCCPSSWVIKVFLLKFVREANYSRISVQTSGAGKSPESLNNKKINDTHRWNEVRLHSVWMQHGDLFSSGPALRCFAGKTLSQPFKTFAAPLHNVSKFPFSQRKPKNVSISLLLYSTHLWPTLRGLQLCLIKLNKQGPLSDCKMKKELLGLL